MGNQKQQRVKVTRAFYAKNRIIKVGSVLDFPSGMAAELRTANKVEFVQSDTKVTDDGAPPKQAAAK